MNFTIDSAAEIPTDTYERRLSYEFQVRHDRTSMDGLAQSTGIAASIAATAGKNRQKKSFQSSVASAFRSRSVSRSSRDSSIKKSRSSSRTTQRRESEVFISPQNHSLI